MYITLRFFTGGIFALLGGSDLDGLVLDQPYRWRTASVDGALHAIQLDVLNCGGGPSSRSPPPHPNRRAISLTLTARAGGEVKNVRAVYRSRD